MIPEDKIVIYALALALLTKVFIMCFEYAYPVQMANIVLGEPDQVIQATLEEGGEDFAIN